MNWLMILVIAVIAGCTVWGCIQGFLRTIYTLAAWIVMIVIVAFATPYAEKALAEHTYIDENIETSVHERIRDFVQRDKQNEITQKNDKSEKEQQNEEKGLFDGKLPKLVTDKLWDADDLADQYLEKSGAYDTVSENITHWIMRTMAFLAVLVTVMLVFSIISHAIDIVSKIPVISGVNHLLGAAAGLIKGILWVWIAFAVIAISSTTSWGTALISYIQESPFLEFIYNNNLILYIIMNFIL